MKTVTVDGAQGEGGGQILRTSCALAALTGSTAHIHSIRAGRSKPGLRAQHLAAVRAAAETCGALLTGDEEGSTELTFEPSHPPQARPYRWDIGTAGSTTLVFQTVFPILSFAEGKSSVVIQGGTHNPMAPMADYLAEVFLPAASRFGFHGGATAASLGFFPKGGGRLVAEIHPASPATAHLERGSAAGPWRSRITGSLPNPSVLTRGAEAIQSLLPGSATEVCTIEAKSTGVAVLIWQELAGFSSLGERGKTIEAVAGEAVAAARSWEASGAACDEQLADQLVILAALAPGESSWTVDEPSLHLKTVIEIAQLFLPSVRASLDGKRVAIHGCGLAR